MSERRRGAAGEFARYVRTFLANLRQPGIALRVRLAKLIRNRFRAHVLLKGCCAHPGEPGC